MNPNPGTPRLPAWLAPLTRRAPLWVWGAAVLVTIVLAAVLVNPSAEQTVIQDPTLSSTSFAVDVFLKFGAVLGLIYLAYYFLRRWQTTRGGSRSRQVAVLETVHLSPRRAVHVIEAGGRRLLIGATDQSINLLTELDSEEDDAAADFSTLLQHAPSVVQGD